MNYLHPVPKPIRETTDYKEKAIATASKIACFGEKCAVCGKHGKHGEVLFAHHIVHRKFGNTCALVENLLPVCVHCHAKIHANETAFKVWLGKIKPGLFDRLWKIARDICRLDFEMVYIELLEQYKRILEEKAKNECV